MAARSGFQIPVGARVTVTEGGPTFYKRGSVGVLVEHGDDGTALVRFDDGQGVDESCGRTWWASHDCIAELAESRA